MRITYRAKDNREYWNERWESIPVDGASENLNVYPMKYAEMIVKDRDGKILEAGCGAGRVLRFYHEQGHDIVGFDFVESVINKLKTADVSLKVEVGDITKLKYPSQSFRYLLAFGLYHNLQNGLEDAIRESYRVLEPGGWLCASVRADNIQTKMVDALASFREWRAGETSERKHFHKCNLTRSEFREAFEEAGFVVKDIIPVENMPLLYKFKFFRASAHKEFNETLGRKQGYQLSPIGSALQNLLVKKAPHEFCNVFVMIAQRPLNDRN